MKDKQLTYKQEKFCQEYAIDYNATRAYMVAYPNTKNRNTAGVLANKLLRNPKIQSNISEIQKNVARSAGISRLRVVNEFKKIAFSSIAHLHETWLTRHDFELLTEDQKACIESIDTKILKRTIPDTEIDIEVEHIKIKLYDKQKALDSINKMLGYNEPEKVDNISSDGSMSPVNVIVSSENAKNEVNKLLDNEND